VGRALEQLVEAIEVEVDQIGCEAIRLGLGDDEFARPLAVRGEVAAEHGDECLERAGGVLWQLFSPEEIGETIRRDAMSARRQQNLKHLLRAAAAEIPRAQRPGAFDRERPEQPDQQTLSMLGFFTHYAPPGRAIKFSLFSDTVITVSVRRAHGSSCVPRQTGLTASTGCDARHRSPSFPLSYSLSRVNRSRLWE
jgi:hypothetical protein